ncbi:hypothetical protein INR49_021956, partial [Caranx melampygus]
MKTQSGRSDGGLFKQQLVADSAGRTDDRQLRSLRCLTDRGEERRSYRRLFRFAQGLVLRQVDTLQEGITQSSATLTKLADTLRRLCKSAMRRMRRRCKQTI